MCSSDLDFLLVLPAAVDFLPGIGHKGSLQAISAAGQRLEVPGFLLPRAAVWNLLQQDFTLSIVKGHLQGLSPVRHFQFRPDAAVYDGG